ncbi:MAG: AraC family transcriptional regulator [Chitinophagaceae bacterium]
MQLTIKNMVCDRCIKSVAGIFRSAGITPAAIRLGVVETEEAIPDATLDQLRNALEAEGFAIVDDQRARLVEQVKQLIIQLVHYGELDEMRGNLSDYLSRLLHKDYNYLSNLFSAVADTTIEQYFILQKTEKVKEWLVYDELTLSEMAFRLGYSSVAHLSAQFKKMTGMTPSQFRKLKDHHRRQLDTI